MNGEVFRNRWLLTGTVVLALSTAALTFGTTASAAPVPIVSYDITQTPRSGFGCWFHDYNGTITNTGRTVTSPPVCSADGDLIAKLLRRERDP